MSTRPFPLGDLHIDARIGRGGAAEVRAATHLPTGAPLAVKRLYQRSETLEREVRAVAALDHPGVLAVYDLLVVPDAPEVPEDWVGQQLLVLERARGSLVHYPTRDVADLARQVLGALAHTHARGLVHRDLKPGNILLGQDGRLKLADFGLAHELGAPIHGSSGTLTYMSPEQVRQNGREIGPWSDLYAFGILAFEVLFGEAPFTGSPVRVLRAHVEDPLPLPAGVDAEVADWFAGMTAKEPAHRFASAPEALAALPSREAFDRSAGGELSHAEISTFSWDDPLPEAPQDAPVPLPEDGPRVVAVPVPPTVPEDQRPRAWIPGTGLGLWGLRTPRVVGREALCQSLWETARAAWSGAGPRALVLRGGAGLGKSHLARWLLTAAREHGAARSFTAVHEPGGDPVGAVADGLARSLQCTGLSTEQRLVHVVRWVTTRGGSLDLARRLAATIGSVGRDVVPAVTRHLEGIAAESPLVVWIDDAQWGPAACDLARRLLDSDGRVLVLCTTRPERNAPLDRLLDHPATEVHELAPLPRRAVEDLVGDALHVDAEVASQVAERAEGHPLFAVQIVEDLVRRRVLVPSPDGYALAEGVTVDLPDDLRIAWTRRVDHLLGDAPDSWRTALGAAAMLGREVDRALWARAVERSGLDVDVDALAERLVRAELWLPGAAATWTFVHGLLAEAVVADVLERGHGPVLHRACDAVLSELEGRRGHFVKALRAWHREALGDLETAARLLAEASSPEAARVSIPAGRRLLDRARALFDQLDAPPEALRDTLALHEARLCETAGAVKEAIPRYEVLLDRIDPERSPKVYALAIHHFGVILGQRDPPAAARLLEESIPLLQAQGLRDQADNSRGILAIRMLRGVDPERGRALLEGVGESRSFNLLLARGQLATTDEEYDAAERWFEAAAEAAIDTGHRTWLVDSWLLRGDLAIRRGDAEEGLRRLQTAEEILIDLGSRERHNMRANRGLVLMHLERFDEARSLFEEVRPDLLENGSLRMVRGVDAALVQTAVRTGRSEEVVGLLERLVPAREAGLLEPMVLRYLDEPNTVADPRVRRFLEDVEGARLP